MKSVKIAVWDVKTLINVHNVEMVTLIRKKHNPLTVLDVKKDATTVNQ